MGRVGVPVITEVTTAGFVTVTLGIIGVGAGKLVSGFLVDVELGTPTATGIHFDFEAIKHLYNTKRSQHAGFLANRAVSPTFSTPRQVKPLKSTQNLAA